MGCRWAARMGRAPIGRPSPADGADSCARRDPRRERAPSAARPPKSRSAMFPETPDGLERIYGGFARLSWWRLPKPQSFGGRRTPREPLSGTGRIAQRPISRVYDVRYAGVSALLRL